MFHLTREVRLTAPGRFLTVQVTLAGEPEPVSGYVIDIKQIDQGVRRTAGPILEQEAITARAALDLFNRFAEVWGQLEHVKVGISPYTSLSVNRREHPMVRFSQKYEFCAAHRLDNPKLSRAENAVVFGKCNNPHGHGHNYELQVTLRGEAGDAGDSGQLLPPLELEKIVSETVLERFDHKFLNIETEEFRQTNPTVENIAQTIYKLLRPRLAEAGARLAEVTVWETPKTWCRYEEET